MMIGATWLRRALLGVLLLLVASSLSWRGGGWGASAAEPGPRAVPARPTGRAVSREALKELVAREMSLQAPGLTEWEVVNRIRDWGYANIDLATAHALLDRVEPFDFLQKDVGEIFTAFFQDRGGVWCGGAAYALAELYRLFGYRASIIDFGHPDVLTHVVTLVRITHRGKRETVVQDPTFNIAYAKRDGSPLDYFDLLRLLLRRQHQNVRMLQGQRREKDLLVHPLDRGLPIPYLHRQNPRPLRVLPDGVKKYRARVSLRDFEAPLRGEIRAFLRKEGHPAHSLYLYLYPIKGTDPAIVEAARRLTGQE